MKRREFLKMSAGLGVLSLIQLAGLRVNGSAESTAPAISLMDLPFRKDALEPYISAKTMEFHYGKHHQAYVDKTNQLIAGTEYAHMALEDIIKNTQGLADKITIFNNAAQVFNHAFYWKSMKPNGGGEPTGKIERGIVKSFGTYQKFVQEFSNAAASQFGSGWAWLAKNDSKLQIIKTANADTPIAHGLTPLLTIDVWEHAYYLDYQNRRGDYITAYLDHLVNWEFAEKNLE